MRRGCEGGGCCCLCFFCVVVAAVGRGDYTGTKQGIKLGVWKEQQE
jgi:hypothetical protein